MRKSKANTRYKSRKISRTRTKLFLLTENERQLEFVQRMQFLNSLKKLETII